MLYHWATQELWEELPSSGHTCRAHNSGCGCHIVPFAWERRPRLKGIGHGLLSAAGITLTPTVGSSRWGLLEQACAVVPWPEYMGGQRCVATDSSRGGRHSYPFSSAPSMDVRVAEADERMRDEYGARRDFVSLSWTSGKMGQGCWRRAWWRPGKNHSSSLLRDGSSGRDYLSPSSLTAFVMTRMSSSSALGLALHEEDDGQRAGSVTEPANSSASEAASERLSSNSPSLEPNEIMSLAAAEGHWSCWAKRMGKRSLCGDGEEYGHWADVSSLNTGCSTPLPRCFLLTGPWEEENGRERRAESLSEKKAICERRELGSALDFPKHDTHSAWLSSACRGFPHVLQWWCGICNNPVLKFALLVRLFFRSHRIAAGDDRICKLVAARGPIQLLRRFNGGSLHQRRVSKDSLHRWREEILVAMAEQLIILPDAPPILAGCNGLHSHWLTRHRSRLQLKKKIVFPYKRLRHSTIEISKGNLNKDTLFSKCMNWYTIYL